MARDFEWFDPANRTHLIALDKRLNQNYFVGLAARRIQQGQVDYLEGESVWEGLLVSGSARLLARKAGICRQSANRFEDDRPSAFSHNFVWRGQCDGVPDQFWDSGSDRWLFGLGWLIGTLDLKAAVAEHRGDLGRLILFFLPCVALIQPNGSLVELFSGSAAALVGAFVWNLTWKRFVRRRVDRIEMDAGEERESH